MAASKSACADVDRLRPGAEVDDRDGDKQYSLNKKSWGTYFIYFLLLALAWFIGFKVFKPSQLQIKDPQTGLPTGVVDDSKALGAAIIISLVILAFIWFFRSK
jgi:hypothetical protein